MERESLCWFYMVVLGVLIITLNLCAPYLTSDKLSSTINWAVVNLIGQMTLVCGRLSVLLRNYGKSEKHLAYSWYICWDIPGGPYSLLSTFLRSLQDCRA